MILEGLGNILRRLGGSENSGEVTAEQARQSLIDAGQPVTSNNLRRRLAELQNDSNQEAPVVPSKAKPQVQPEAPPPVSNWRTREQQRIEKFNAGNAVAGGFIPERRYTRGAAPPVLETREVIEKVFQGVEPESTSYSTPIHPEEGGFIVNYQKPPPNSSTRKSTRQPRSAAGYNYIDFTDDIVQPKIVQSPSQAPVTSQQRRTLFPEDQRPKR